MDRTVSGDISGNDSVARFSVLSDDSAMPLEEQSNRASATLEGETITAETNLSNDKDMNDDMEDVFKSKENRRRELRSVLKNKNPTPRLDSDLSVKRESFRQSPSGNSEARECCVIL